MTILRDIRRLLRNETVVQACFTGKMGRGKTNALKYLVKLHRSDEAYYFNVHDSGGFGNVVAALNELKGHVVKGEGRVALLFDDISWYAMHYEEEIEEFLKFLANIRRFIIAKRYLIAAVQHYPYATLPFIREAHINAVFSLTSRNEFEAFREVFSRRYLKRFYQRFREEALKGRKGLMLVNVLGKEEITRFPLVKETPWKDMTVQQCYSAREAYSIDKKYKYADVVKRNGTVYVYARFKAKTLKKTLEKALATKEEVLRIPIIRLKTAT